MAYKTEYLYDLSMEAVTSYKPINITELIKYLPCAESTWREHFPLESEGYKKITQAIHLECVKIKSSIRAKWYQKGSGPESIALYKLLGTEDEVHRLNGSRQEIKQETTYKHEPVQMTAEEAKKYLDSADIA